jgi:hypothetical protein
MNPLGIFIEEPYLGFIQAMIFGVVFFRKRQYAVGITALLWLLYAIYEISIKLRIACSGECNIRVDLLLIYPVLIALTIFSILKAFDAWG